MRLLRLEHRGDLYFAQWVDEATARLWTGAPFGGGAPTDRLVPLKPGRLRAPVQPSKIVCVGRNYAAHARELGHEVPKEPLLFLKAPSSITGPDAPIRLPAQSQQVEFEGEIGVVIGATLTRPNREQAAQGIHGITAVNDVTARDLQRADVQFTRAKSFDSFCPVGPFVETDFDLSALALRTRVNGETRQHASVDDMVVGIVDLITYVAAQMTLCPGDLICTGTPAGVGALREDDTVEVEVLGVGAVLRNPVAGP